MLKIQRYLKIKVRRRLLFQATDFQTLMYPCFMFCRILGIFPYKINSSTLEASKPHYIMSTVIVSVFCIVDAILLHAIISFKLTFGSIARSLEVVCLYVVCGITMIFMHVSSGSQMRLLQIISKIFTKLPSESYQHLSRLIHIKDILGPIFMIIQICVYHRKIHLSDSLQFLKVVFSMYSILLIFQINMLYINCICIIKVCFKNINDNLAHVQKLVENDMEQCVSTMTYGMQRNQFLQIKLKTLRKYHLMVSDAIKTLNTFFSLQLLASIVIIFSNITFELYFYVVRWENGLLIRFDMCLFDMFLSVITCHGIIMMLLVWACETCKNQAHEIRTTIHDVLNNTSDEQIKHELQLFSLQILHCENVFSAKGFTVDATLLAAMVGNITTYMLILIQFMITSHSCDGKSILHM